MTEGCVPQKGCEHTVIPVAIVSIMLCGNNGKKQVCLLQLKIVPGEEFIFKYTPSHICISKR
jgi:hypothetical protein